MRFTDDQNLPVSRLHPPPLGRTGSRGQGQPTASRVRPQEHGLRRRLGRLCRPRVQGHAEQWRTPLQTVEAGKADEHRDRLVCRHPPCSLPHWSCRVRPLAGVVDKVKKLISYFKKL